MRIIADFHIHSKYSRATSKDMDIPHLAQWAKYKGISLMATGDFTHPLWLHELKASLKPSATAEGFYEYDGINFILTAEVCNIFSVKGQVKRVHNVLFAPSFEAVDKINKELGYIGNLEADGRPIFGLAAEELVKIALSASPDCMVVPGHAWTPWFGIFGANSGFDSVEECFGKEAKNIYCLETGLSSDPAMNWRLSKLDKYSLISNSDSHCVHPDTKIYTINNKPIAIKESNSLKVLSIDFTNDLRQRVGRASKLHKLPSPPVLYKITTRNKWIITTSEHRFFVLENEQIVERRICELKAGDLVACLRQITDEGKSIRLPGFTIDHELKIFPEGIDYLRSLRIKNKMSQKEIGRYIGVGEDCIWIFEKCKIRTPKESFIDRYCEYLNINKSDFKRKFLIQSSPLEKFPNSTNEQFCQILGYLIGDGGIERSREKIRQLSLTDKNINLLTCYQNLIKEVFNIEGRLRKKKGNSNSLRYPDYLAEYFQGINPKILVSSPERQIPEFVFNLPKEELAAFLGGLFDAEGTCGHHFISFSSSSLILIKEIQVLLLKFGLSSHIYPDFEKNKKRWRYQLNIYSQEQLRKFVKEIKFSCDIKRKKLLQYLNSLSKSPKNSFVDSLPLREEILRVKKELAVSYYDIPKRLYYHLGHKNSLKRENVKEFLKIFSNYLISAPSNKKLITDKLKRFAESDIIWENVQEIKKVKSDCKYVYDLTVPNYENYVANGFITHNSPAKIGREANIFDCKMSYKEIITALKTKDRSKFLYTVEFFPQEGKYHWDGHRVCAVRQSPAETKKNNFKCPRCGKPVTVGVESRVEKLADRPEGFVPQNSVPFKNMIPLLEIIAEARGKAAATQGVEDEYMMLVKRFNSEFNILFDMSKEELEANLPDRIAQAVLRVREGRVHIAPGYDGVYGEIKIFGEDDKPQEKEKQMELF